MRMHRTTSQFHHAALVAVSLPSPIQQQPAYQPYLHTNASLAPPLVRALPAAPAPHEQELRHHTMFLWEAKRQWMAVEDKLWYNHGLGTFP